MGTPDFAVSTLDLLVKNEFNIVGVVTASDKLGGRGGKQLLESEVKKYAIEHGLNVLQPDKLKSKAFLKELSNLQADVQVVVAFRMLPEMVWAMPKYGTYNVHGSLLPKYRGAAPINWAIINGETKTGVTVFKLQHEIDTGKILMQESTPIFHDDNFGKVYDRLKIIGANLLVKALGEIGSNIETLYPQDDALTSHAPKIFHETCLINFESSSEKIRNFVRGLAPYPSAHFIFNEVEMKVYDTAFELIKHDELPGTINSDRKKFLKIATLDGYIHLLDVKLEGKKRMLINDFLNGYKWT